MKKRAPEVEDDSNSSGSSSLESADLLSNQDSVNDEFNYEGGEK